MPTAPPPVGAGTAAQAAYARQQDLQRTGGNRLAGPAVGNALAVGAPPAGTNLLAAASAQPAPSAPPAPPMPPPSPMPPAQTSGPIPGPAPTPPSVGSAVPIQNMAEAHAQVGAANLSDAALQGHADSMDAAAHLLGQLIDKGSKVTAQDATTAALGAVKDGVISPQLAGSFLQQIRTGDPAKLADQLKVHLANVLQAGVILAQHQQTRAGAGAS